jgi:hypothetical protein
MKGLLRVFVLSRSEQRVVLIIILALIAGAFVGYERRVHHPPVQPAAATEPTRSPSPAEADDDR